MAAKIASGSDTKTASGSTKASSSGPQSEVKWPLPESLLPDFDIVVNNDTLLWIKVKRKIPVQRTNICLHSLMESFLFPISVSDFEKHIFHKRAFAVTGLGGERIVDLIKDQYCNGDPGDLIDNTASEDGVSVWLRGAGAIQSFKTDNKDLAKALLTSKSASVYMRAPPQTCQQLTMHAYHGLGIPLGMYPDGKSRGEVEVFLASGEESRKTPTHTDFQENFTIQLQGHKIWQLHLGDVRNPIRAKAPHFANTPDSVRVEQMLASQMCGGSPYIDPPCETGEGWITVELGPGDILYHPPGIWHNVQTSPKRSGQEEFNLSTNISLVAPTWAELLGQAVRQLCASNEILRRPASILDFSDAQDAVAELGLSLGGHLNHLTSLVPIASYQATRLAAFISSQRTSKNEEEEEVDDEEEDDEILSNSEVFVKRWEDFHSILSNELADNTYAFNKLALLAMENDLNPEEEEDNSEKEDDDEFNVEVHVNKGTDDLESVCTFQLIQIPKVLLPGFIQLREYARKNKEISGEQLKEMFGDGYKSVFTMLGVVGYFDIPFDVYEEIHRSTV